MPTLRIQTKRTTISGECAIDKLVRDICIRFSPDTPDTQGTRQVQDKQDDNDTGSPAMGQTVLVLPHSGVGTGTTIQVPKKKGPTNHAGLKGTTPRAREPKPGSIAPEDLEFAHLKLPASTMAVLREARRPITRKCYMAKWKRFSCWCIKENLQRKITRESTVLRYLTHLLQSNLSYTSLKVHLAAIVAYTRGETGKSFFSSQVVKRFLEGAKRIAPPKRMPPPAWKLNVVLTQLMKAPFEPMHKTTLHMLTLKAAFLVAITSL